MQNITAEDIERYWAKVEIAGPDDCWPWRAGMHSMGYGAFSIRLPGGGYRMKPAHQISAFLSYGPSNGRYALHSCDNRPCCNPRHLRYGTQTDNMQDAKQRGRLSAPPIHRGPAPHRNMPKGEDVKTSKMTNATVAEIYKLRLTGMSSMELAKRFDIDKSTILDIIGGRYWAHQLGANGNPTLAELAAIERNTKPGAKITMDMARAIKTAIAAGETGRSIALRFGIHFASVSDIKQGKTWREA